MKATTKRAVKNLLPSGLIPLARRLAIAAGWAVDPAPMRLEYPFRGLMKQGRARPNYRWGTLCAALLAKTLGEKKMSVIEFGVAGGNGLLHLEKIAASVAAVAGLEIEVYGFDTGQGLTKPQDYRDLPQLWNEGQYPMDVEGLRKRLRRAQLILGPVAETVPTFVRQSPAPVGFIAFDLDMYSSTMDAFKLFDAGSNVLLPRVVCYFDDVMGYSHSDFTGERLAITEFNQAHDRRKISQTYGLRNFVDADDEWLNMMYMFHAFDHPRYNDFDGFIRRTELPLAWYWRQP